MGRGRRTDEPGRFRHRCSKLAIDHSLDHPDKILTVYALQNRIRPCASESVVAATECVIRSIGQQYMKENLAPGALRHVVLGVLHDPDKREDPLKIFSDACGRELASL